MINVSNSFKKAIKSDERICKGYVEVICNDLIDKETYNFSGVGDNVAEITTLSQIKDGKRIVNKYASFEENYFLLDGSFILPSEGENYNAGYISAGISNENGYFLGDNYTGLNIKINSTTLNSTEGLTIYFEEDNYATNLRINDVEYINEDNVLNIFDKIDFIDGVINIYIDRILNSKQRLRINEIDLGVSNIYKDNDLISFNIIEKVDVLKQEMPINECNIVLNNIDGKFNSINPTGVAKYLDGATIKPYVGVLTEDLGIEYCPCGVFFVDNWKNNSETTTNITAYTFFKKMSEEDSYVIHTSTSFLNYDDYLNYMFNVFYITNYEILANLDEKKDNCFINDQFAGKRKQLDNLREVLILCNIIGFVNRYGKIIIDKISNLIVDEILLAQCKKMPTFETKEMYNKIIINQYNGITEQVEKITTYQETITVTGERNQTLIIDYGNNIGCELSYEGIMPDYLTTREGYNFYFIQFYSNLWENIPEENLISGTSKITLTKWCNKSLNKIPHYFEINKSGQTLEINNTLYNLEMQTYIDRGSAVDTDGNGMLLSRAMKNTVDFIKDQNSQYKVEINYNGDPSLEAGDLINIETRYGMKTIRIQELTLNFNGSLSGNIIGVGN